MTNRWKKILAIAWPLIIANSFWNLQMTIDRIFIGMLSTEALGAAMAVLGVFWVPMALLQQTAAYVATFVAQYYGAGEKSRIGATVWQAIYVSVIGGVAFLFLSFFSDWFFSLVGHSKNIQVYEVEYFNALTFSALPAAMVAVFSGFYTGIGVTRMVTLINLVGLVLNVALDYLLIFGNLGFPAMGVAGAGYATAIANLGAALFGFFTVYNSNNEAVYKMKSSLRVNWALLRQFLRFGLPSGMQWAFEGMAFTVFLIIMGRLPNGDAALAASSIAVTVMMLSVLPAMGVAQAVMTLVGQYLGDKNPERAVIATWDGVRISIIYIGLVAVSFFSVPDFFVSWFHNSENAALWDQTKVLTAHLLKIVAIFTLFDSVYLNISFALKGAGDTKFVSLAALAMPWPIMVLPAYLVMGHEHAVFLAWMFAASYAILVTAVLTLRFRQGKWKTMSVIEEQKS